MRVKLFLFFLIFLLPAGQAIARPGITFGPNGELYEYWTEKGEIKYAKSTDQGLSFSAPQTLFSLTEEAELSTLKVDYNSNFYFTYLLSGEVVLQAKKNNGKTWDPPLTINITKEAIHAPEVTFDDQAKLHSLFVLKVPYLGLNRLYYSSIPSIEPKALFESQDDISNPLLFCFPQALVAMWKTNYSNRSENYISVSINSGESFSSPLRLPLEEFPASFTFEDGKPKLLFVSAATPPEIIKREIISPPFPAPEIIALNTQATPEIACRVYTSDPLLYKFEISPAKDFPEENTLRFDYVNKTASPEARFRLPVKLEEGDYFLRASSFDGLASSLYTKTASFKIDLTPPSITLLYPTRETTAQKAIVLRGTVNEKSALLINGNYCSLEAFSFNALLNLHSGKNLIEIRASDEAGNISILTQSITCSSEAPEILLQSPKETDWFRPGSTLLFSGQVYDAQNDLEDETEAKILLPGILLTDNDNPVYYQETQKISGFISLPKDLPEGKFPGKILLTDQNGNTGEAVFEIKIDKTPPFISKNVVFSNLANSFSPPLEDSGAGVNTCESSVKINGVTLFTATTETKSFIPFLADGSYEVEVTPKDLAGNIGKPGCFTLRIDTRPPQFSVSISSEAQSPAGKFIVKGEAIDPAPVTINVYNNQKLLASLPPDNNLFTKEIFLPAGWNEIEVSAVDEAGNAASRKLSVFSSASAAGDVISSCGNGPNPFSPARDGQMSFVYTLPASANLVFYIFDLSGTLVWKKGLANAASGSLAWNGVDNFGVTVDRGVYPYLMKASAGGKTESRRGKIIVY